jgi:uncharacterized protein (TIGR01777 family)
MRIVITGATGTIGQALIAALQARGDSVVALSRNPERARETVAHGVEVHAWSAPDSTPPPADALSGADAVVHLLGARVDQRWTPEAKRAIRGSRELGTRMLVTGLRALPAEERPSVLVSQSATGYYGPRGDEVLDEQALHGSDFLAQVVTAWEGEAEQAASLTRVVCTRTGVVVSPGGGALAKMLPFFRLGLGGPVAGGRQYIPWVHLEDVVGAMIFAIDSTEASGAANLTAPNPVTNAEFSRALGHALRRPAVLPVPGFGLRLLYGEMSEIVIGGQRAVPRRLQDLGYQFRHPEIGPALADVVAT